MKEPGLSSLVAEILYTNEEEKHFLSHDMERTSESIIHWLERRIIPKSRTFPDKILKALDIFDFSGILALVSYTGAGVYHIPGADYRRYTPQGMRHAGQNRICLYKDGIIGASNTGRGTVQRTLRFSGFRNHVTKRCTLRSGEVGGHSNI